MSTPQLRHQPHPHHRSMTWIALATAAGLVIILVLTLGESTPPPPKFEPPNGSMSHEVDTATAGLTQDMTALEQVDVSGADLNESLLAP